MDALLGQTLNGTVSNLATTGQNQQGVVSYQLSIRVEVPEGLELLEGLSAVANVIIYEENDVLMVPIQVLYGTYEQPVVRVMNNGNIEEQEVALGNNDGFWIVVQDGLYKGQEVVMETQQASTEGGFQAMRGMVSSFGGNMGGGFSIPDGGGKPAIIKR